MNIIDTLKDNVKNDGFFFNQYSGANEKENTEKIVTEFLNCEDERHRETLASLIINYHYCPINIQIISVGYLIVGLSLCILNR